MVRILLPKPKPKTRFPKAPKVVKAARKRILRPALTSTKAFLPGAIGDKARAQVRAANRRAPKGLRVASEIAGPPTSRGGAAATLALSAIPGGRALRALRGRGLLKGAKGAGRSVKSAFSRVFRTPGRRAAGAAGAGGIAGYAVGAKRRSRNRSQSPGRDPAPGGSSADAAYDDASESPGGGGPPITDNPIIPNFLERPAYEVGEAGGEVGTGLVWVVGVTFGALTLAWGIKKIVDHAKT